VGLGVSLSRGLCWFISGVAVGIQCDTWCSPVDLLNVSQAGLELVSGGRGALLFLSVMWCVEAFYRQRFGVMTFWFFLVLYLCQGWLQLLSKIFDLQSSHCLLLLSSCHCGSLHIMFLLQGWAQSL
jgi:hypothetical protein